MAASVPIVPPVLARCSPPAMRRNTRSPEETRPVLDARMASICTVHGPSPRSRAALRSSLDVESDLAIHAAPAPGSCGRARRRCRPFPAAHRQASQAKGNSPFETTGPSIGWAPSRGDTASITWSRGANGDLLAEYRAHRELNGSHRRPASGCRRERLTRALQQSVVRQCLGP